MDKNSNSAMERRCVKPWFLRRVRAEHRGPVLKLWVKTPPSLALELYDN